jgi:transposase
MGSAKSHQVTRKEKSITIIAAGIDLAKNVFAVHGVNEAGVVQLRQLKVSRGKLNALIATLRPCVIAMEACSGAHNWARQFQAHGHMVRLIAPKLVAPYRMSGKRGEALVVALSGTKRQAAQRQE